MSDHLVNWFKDSLTSLYQSALDSAQGKLSSTVESLFEGDAHIIYNHEQIDLAKLDEALGISSALAIRAEVEWKEVMSSTVGGNNETQQDAIVTGYFIVTRSMKFRIRAAPAQTLQHCFFSAKIKGDLGNKEGAPAISELFITSISKQAPIRFLQ